MVRILRMAAFLVSAISVQIASGIGAAALALAFLLGFLRASPVWAALPMLAGAATATWMFEGVSSPGKVVNAESNFVFVLIVYAVISVCGYALGRLAARWRRAPRG